MPGTGIDDPVQNLVWRGVPASVQFSVSVFECDLPAPCWARSAISQNSIP